MKTKNMNPFPMLGVCALLIAVTGAGADAAVIYAEDDNTVRYLNGVQTPTGDLLLKKDAGGAGSSSNRIAYTKFDLTGLDADGSQGASFNITYLLGSTGLPSLTIEAYGLNTGFVPSGSELGTDWSETDLQSSTAHGLVNGHTLDGTKFTSLGTFTIVDPDTDGDTTYSTSIGTLSNFLQSDNTVTIAFLSNTATGPGIRFYSSETGTTLGDTGTAPRLEFSVIPEPSSIALLLMGGLTMGIFLRRRTR